MEFFKIIIFVSSKFFDIFYEKDYIVGFYYEIVYDIIFGYLLVIVWRICLDVVYIVEMICLVR